MAAEAPAAAPAGDGGFFFEAPGSSSGWEEPPDQYHRIVTFVPDDDMGERRQKRGQEERSSPPAKRQRSEASPAAASPAVHPSSSLSQHTLQRIAESVPPGGKGEALLLQAVERSCPRGEERQGGELGNALAKLDRCGMRQLSGGSFVMRTAVRCAALMHGCCACAARFAGV